MKPHPLLRRHVFYAHRDLQEILDCYEKGSPFYLYTGRVSLHLRWGTLSIKKKNLMCVCKSQCVCSGRQVAVSCMP